MSLPAAERELVIERVFDAPRELVFKVWTTTEGMLEWWGPTFCPAKRVQMDIQPGGKWRCCLDSQVHGGDLWQNGIFREVKPYDLLVFTFVWEAPGDMGVENTVTIRFYDENGKTRMHFTQAPFPSTEQRDSNNGGWSNMFNRLEAYLKKQTEVKP